MYPSPTHVPAFIASSYVYHEMYDFAALSVCGTSRIQTKFELLHVRVIPQFRMVLLERELTRLHLKRLLITRITSKWQQLGIEARNCNFFGRFRWDSAPSPLAINELIKWNSTGAAIYFNCAAILQRSIKLNSVEFCLLQKVQNRSNRIGYSQLRTVRFQQ